MSSVVAIVKSIVGQVIAVSPEGARRVLIEGDRLLAGEQVLTGLAGAVTLELADGRTLDLGRDTQWSADAPDSSTDLSAATAQAAPSVEELQQAIAAGADPTTELEATAAGPSAAGLVVLPVVATASSCWMPRQARLIRPLASRLPLSVLPPMTTAWIWAAWTMPITRTPPRLRANPA